MKVHDLKINPTYMTKIFEGNKNWELRKNDRDFEVEDWICVREYENNSYTGIFKFGLIQFILQYFVGLQEDYCLLSIEWAHTSDISEIPEIKKFMKERGLK